jgi:hypothetical protein
MDETCRRRNTLVLTFAVDRRWARDGDINFCLPRPILHVLLCLKHLRDHLALMRIARTRLAIDGGGAKAHQPARTTRSKVFEMGLQQPDGHRRNGLCGPER